MTNNEALKYLAKSLDLENYPSGTPDDLYADDYAFDCLKTLEEEIKVLEIIKKYFYFKVRNCERGKFIWIVGKDDWDFNDGIDAIAGSKAVEDNEFQTINNYLKEIKNERI